MSRTFRPTPAYHLFLKSLIQTRIDRGYSLEQLAELISLTSAQVASFEAGEHPLGFIDVRNWLLALDMPFAQFTQQMDNALDSTLTADESITYPESEDDVSERYARADPLPHQIPTIQVLFFAPGEIPEVRTIQNTLEAKQALVQGLITTFETGADGTIGIANDEALLEDMPFNRPIPATNSGIFGPFLVAGDVDGGFRSLKPFELERTLATLAPELSHLECVALMDALDGGRDWMEMWN
jgi:transcriptional regulator with XRE-family HTH domain